MATIPSIEELPDLATRAQLAAVTQTSVPTLARWAGEGKGPRYVKLGGAVRYRREDVLAWLANLGQTEPLASAAAQ